MIEGFLCEVLDLNKWVLLEVNLILKEGIELEVLNTSKECPKWDKAIVKFNKDFNELVLYMYDTGDFKKVSSNYLVRVNK